MYIIIIRRYYYYVLSDPSIGFRRPDKDSLSFLVFPYAYIYDLL